MIIRDLPCAFPSVVHMLNAISAKWPEREAIVCGPRRLSYGEYRDLVSGFAQELLRRNMRGKRVLLLLGNSIEICIAMFAIHSVSGQAIALNPLYTSSELRGLISDAEPEIILYDALSQEVIGNLKDFLKSESIQLLRMNENYKSRLILAEPEPSSVATIQYTGGTTGKPKGAILTHSNIAINISQRQALLPTSDAGERILSVLPLFHVYGMAMCLYNSVCSGASLIILPRYNPESLIELFHAEAISIFAGSPTIFVGLMSCAGFTSIDFSPLKFSYSGSSPLSPSVLSSWEQATGAPVLEGYGLSEAGPVVSFNPLHGKRKAGSVGKIVPFAEVKIASPIDGTKSPDPGLKGEVCIRGPQLMLGYRNRPEETTFALRDGWLYTGDIGELDSEGYLYITDRVKDMIIVSGYNVYPREIEDLLYKHDSILEVAVVGVTDPYRGEIIKAYIASVYGSNLKETDLEEYCKKHLAKYKVPSQFEIVSELPKTIVGKIDKIALRKRNNDQIQ